MKYPVILIILSSLFLFPSCEKFLNPEQKLDITQDRLFNDWYEYRSVEMGMYGLQQKLVEQLVVLGELRGDLLTITQNADADLRDVYNFNISRDNKYASPTNFFKLISASNNFIRVLKREHPEVLDPESPVSNFDKLYGEALCMRAWAYFNAVRIYGVVPYIPESLVTINEIENFVNSPGTYVDSVYINFGADGYYNDTTINKPVTLEKQFYNTDQIIDIFTDQLEHDVKDVGVNHYIENNDISWQVTIWNKYALHALFGQMYLTRGDLLKARNHFNSILWNSEAAATEADNRANNVTNHLRYQLDNTFLGGLWRNIFTTIDNNEHIYTIWFNKANFQQNKLQDLFDPRPPHKYMLQPSGPAIYKFETVWYGQQMGTKDPLDPAKTKMTSVGYPGDFYRGFGSSYLYLKGNGVLDPQQFLKMLDLRMHGDERGVKAIMDGVDTIVWKYSIDKGTFDQDANFIVYRAGSIHLYQAEILTHLDLSDEYGAVFSHSDSAINLVNNGSYFNDQTNRYQRGVKGRAGIYFTSDDGIKVGDDYYIHDPYTNKIVGYRNLNHNLPAKQEIIEDGIMDERARELAYEGERFYDLMRVSYRRNDPTYLAKAVAAKFPESQRSQIEALLSNPYIWYIHYFD